MDYGMFGNMFGGNPFASMGSRFSSMGNPFAGMGSAFRNVRQRMKCAFEQQIDEDTTLLEGSKITINVIRNGNGFIPYTIENKEESPEVIIVTADTDGTINRVYMKDDVYDLRDYTHGSFKCSLVFPAKTKIWVTPFNNAASVSRSTSS